MSVKGWAEAHRYKGGIIKYLYDKVKALDTASGGDETDIASIKEAIGKSTSGSETGFYKDIKDINTAIGNASDPAEGTILYRLYQLEHPPANSGTE